MSKFEKFKSQTLLGNGVKLICDLDIPFPEHVKEELKDDRMNLIEPLLKGQYLNSIKRVLSDYQNSPLPEKFILEQAIIVMNLSIFDDLYGMFNLVGDDIVVDTDAILGIRLNAPASFLFGHEMGHKIAKYKATRELYESIANILGIFLDGNYHCITETYADECGNMVSPIIHEHGILPYPLDKDKREGIQKTILNNIYK